jgi:spoIIIJ-associated protein
MTQENLMENIWEGKTIESAISTALKELKCTEQDVEIEVLQEPVKGIFGIVKAAKVRVVPRQAKETRSAGPAERTQREPAPVRVVTEEDLNRGLQAVETLVKLMGLEGTLTTGHIESGSVILEMKSDSEGLLIGRHGRTREALQYIVERIANQSQKEKTKYIVDIGGYLNRQREMLHKMAERGVEKVRSSHHEEHLPAMNAFDRRIVHLFLKDHPEVMTFSQGDGENRHIVIAVRDEHHAD